MIYHLVRFLEDGILYVCPASKVRKGIGNTRKVRYKWLGTFDAKIISTGNKADMYKEMATLLYREDTVINPSSSCDSTGEQTLSRQLICKANQCTSSLQQYDDMADFLPEYIVTQSEESTGTGTTVEKLASQPEASIVSREIKCLQTLHSIPCNSPASAGKRIPSKQLTCKTDQYEDMAISSSKNLATPSDDSQISTQLESIQIISPTNSPGNTTEYLVTQPEDNQISSELQCLHTLQPISPCSSTDSTEERTPSKHLICKTDQCAASLQQYEDISISSPENLVTQLEDNQIYSPLESLQTLQTISPTNSTDSIELQTVSCKRQLSFDSLDEIISPDFALDKVVSLEIKSKNTMCADLNAPNKILLNTTSLRTAISVSDSVPVCTGVIHGNVNSGIIEVIIEKILHKGTYSGNTFANDTEHTLTGMIVVNKDQMHICVFSGTDMSPGLITINLSNLRYDCNLSHCVHPGTYQCKGYLVKSSNSFIAELPTVLSSVLTSSTNSNISDFHDEQNKLKRKKHYCPYCKKMQFAFARHVLNQHNSEEDVKNILLLPKGSNDRKKKLSLLRGKGMHIYNMNTLENGGTKLVVRNPRINNPNLFVPCPNCNGYFLPRNVARHQKRCVNRAPNKIRVLSIAKELQRRPAPADQLLLQQLLSQLREDNITEIIKSDKVLLLLAATMAVKYAKEKHLGNFMRQKLRQLGRLLIKMRELDNQITDLESCFTPCKYDTIKRAVYDLCELDTNTFTYKKPSMAAQLGAMLKDSAHALKVQNIKDGYRASQRQEIIDDFLLIHEKEYGALVSKSAVTTLEQNKWNKKQIMPSIDDIQKFQDYIKERAEHSYKYLCKFGFKYDIWLTLGKCCLLILLTFNSRRVGEMSRMLIKDFEGRQAIREDQYKTLNRLECILADTFQRLEIRGKKGRRVPVLLTSEHITFIELILKFRNKAGVLASNPYVFGVAQKKEYIDAAVAIRDYSMKCGASDPESIRGTYLRKQVATISQMLNLNDNEIQQLADFMGHDVAIHRLHYRKPEISLQVTRLAKFFMAVGGSDVEKYRGKTLDEIEVADPALGDGVCNSDSEISDVDAQSTSTSSQSERKFYFSSSGRTQNKGLTLNLNLKDLTPEKTTPKKTTPKKKFRYTDLTIVKCIKSPVRRRVIRRSRWTSEERAIVTEEFKNCLENNTLPCFQTCMAVRQKYSKILAGRTSAQIKAWVYNELKKKKSI